MTDTAEAPDSGNIVYTSQHLRRTGRKQGNETFERLYEEALAEFRRVGFVEAKVENIAKKAGISRAAFYFHFPSKDDVLMEFQRRTAEEVLNRIGGEGAEFVPTPKSIKAFMEIALEGVLLQARVEENRQLIKEQMILQMRKTPSEIDDNPIEGLIQQFFAQASEDGLVRSDMPSVEIAKAFKNCMLDLFREVADNPEGYEESCRHIVNIFIRGVSA